MSSFVHTSPFLKTALWVAMETIFGEHFFRIKGVQLNNLVPMTKCPGGGAR